MNRILPTLVLAWGVAASTFSANAAGLVGQRFFAATFDVVSFDEPVLDPGVGISLMLNQPVDQSFDLFLEYSYLTAPIVYLDDDVTSHQLMGGVRWYSSKHAKAKPFVDLAIGGVFVKADEVSDDQFVYDATVGIELAIGDKIRLAPYVGYTDSFESDVEGSVNYGVIGELGLGKSWSLLARVFGDDDSNYGGSLGLKFAY
jgi:hypothetical protein